MRYIIIWEETILESKKKMDETNERCEKKKVGGVFVSSILENLCVLQALLPNDCFNYSSLFFSFLLSIFG